MLGRKFNFAPELSWTWSVSQSRMLNSLYSQTWRGRWIHPTWFIWCSVSVYPNLATARRTWFGQRWSIIIVESDDKLYKGLFSFTSCGVLPTDYAANHRQLHSLKSENDADRTCTFTLSLRKQSLLTVCIAMWSPILTSGREEIITVRLITKHLNFCWNLSICL